MSIVPRHNDETDRKINKPKGTPVLSKAPGIANTPAPKRPLKKINSAIRVLVLL
jgi:hypothetical protein